MIKRLCLLLILCLVALPALAEEQDFAAAWFASREAELIPFDIPAETDAQTYAFTLADGRTALSLRLTAEGNLRFGRYAQITRAALIDAGTGETLGLDSVFTDLDTLQDFLDDYVERNVLDELNTYLDVGELLPVPLENVSFDEYGVTFHYSSERFAFFSGHAGAVQLQWYELEELLLVQPESAMLSQLQQGNLCGVSLNTPIEELIDRYGRITEPDYVDDGGLIYEFEAPALRGVQAIDAGHGKADRLRTARFDLAGVRPGMSCAEAMGRMWMPTAIELISEEAAKLARVLPGSVISYRLDVLEEQPAEWMGNACISLYFDQNDTLYLLELWLD